MNQISEKNLQAELSMCQKYAARLFHQIDIIRHQQKHRVVWTWTDTQPQRLDLYVLLIQALLRKHVCCALSHIFLEREDWSIAALRTQHSFLLILVGLHKICQFGLDHLEKGALRWSVSFSRYNSGSCERMEGAKSGCCHIIQVFCGLQARSLHTLDKNSAFENLAK